VQDSNSARTAVAENYMKACNGIWITADIQRAINAKAAKQLLGDSFKRQLKYDGAFSAVTFICTKADDILTTEVQNSLNIKDELGDYWEQIEQLGCKRDKLTLHIDSLKQEKRGLEGQLDDLETSYEQWEELQKKLADGEPVCRPFDISKKRKRETTPEQQRETRSSVGNLSDQGNLDAGPGKSSYREVGQAFQVPETPLTEDVINNEIATIKTKRKEARNSKKNFDYEIAKAEQELAEVTAEEAAMHSEMRSLCIRGRSKYVKDAIKRDFVLGIKE